MSDKVSTRLLKVPNCLKMETKLHTLFPQTEDEVLVKDLSKE